ncbi:MULTISPECIES: hypothetical protein [Rhodococcus]|uniref:DUF1499 domain-containing protein n=1 Tax=Rhodococcus artemisiae TaxID=714159 RepID=A0ABU7LL50_9NOCA|nr:MULTISPECIES: hypothetical protein [Rhodococcus]MDV6297241.1 hypothetical protein [Rhodococcus aetherivorans]MEE2062298.1 hypothetical protein [Rhodococcus artemisiae]
MKGQGYSRVEEGSAQLPEERQFKRVLIGVSVAVVLFALAFLVLTLVKSSRSPQDITSNWFVAWGTWAGGLGTAAAFLIAAFSISVASAHARLDRRQATEIREDKDMAQARLLIIYKVEDEHSIPSLATYRIENRSRDFFFDVTVPYVDSPYGSDASIECRTADLVAQDNRLGEFIPTAEQLTPYRDHTDHEAWFTLVTVHTSDARGIRFAVEYTDAGGRRWRQELGGEITRVHTLKAVPIRPPDRFQPPQQIRRLSDVELRRFGSGFSKGLEPLESDEEFLEVIEASNVECWKRIGRIEDIVVEADDAGDRTAGLHVSVTFSPKAPPLWGDHFRGKLAESGLCYAGGDSQYTQTDRFRCPPQVDTAGLGYLIDAAIKYANDRFEENELAAARRALDARRNRTRPSS